uniref:Uncharacterized protein n=1 Tax=Neovison vison TaxID=452646 RepID=A0A8C7EV70_NEOVI
ILTSSLPYSSVHILGPKNWVPLVGMWGALAIVRLMWATDWWLMLDSMSHIKSKFRN